MLFSRQLPNFVCSCRSTLIPLWLFFAFVGNRVAAAPPVHVWEKQEVTFRSARTWANPYTDVTVWVDLKGPNFRKRIYGFWDGERTFRVRFLATVPGEWKWESGSNPRDPGLSGRHGEFKAVAWSEKEKEENPLRRGFLRATANHHAIEQADGTPFLWSVIPGIPPEPTGFVGMRMTNIVRLGPRPASKIIFATGRTKATTLSLSLLRFRRGQRMTIQWSFSWIIQNGPVYDLRGQNMEPRARKIWRMKAAVRFCFLARCPVMKTVFPDLDRINPAYFRYLDRKIEYLNEQGFIPIHRSCTPRHRPGLEKILFLARFLCALHPVRVVPLPGQQHRVQPHSLRY